MKAIIPKVITDAAFISSTITENDFAVWNSATAYAVDQKCISTVTHRIYKCLIAHTNADPTLAANTAAPSPKWLDIGPTNKWACVDFKVGTQTVGTTNTAVTMTFAPGRCDAVAFINMDVASIHLVGYSPSEGMNVYDQTINLNTSDDSISDWYDYFFADFITITDYALLDLPPYSDIQLTVTLTNPGGQVKIGGIYFGMQFDLGITQKEPEFSIRDYSTKEPDAFGNYDLEEGAYSKKMDVVTVIDKGKIDSINNFLSSVRAKNIVYLGTENMFSSFIQYGFIKDFKTKPVDFSSGTLNAQVEGMI